jgi:hypothetical protein
VGRGKRARPLNIKVVCEPVDAPLAEYEQAWIEALGVIHRLARDKRARDVDT